MEQLSTRLGRLQVAWISFALAHGLYWVGALNWVLSWPSLAYVWTLPTLMVLGVLFSWVLESLLDGGRVNPEGKALLITGCDSGFGHMLAQRLASKGYTVFAGCLFPTAEGAKALVQNNDIVVLPMDVTSDESVSHAMERLEQGLGERNKELWAVVANAGISGGFCPVEWCSMERVRQVFDVNTFGVLRTTTAALPFLRKTNGRVIITSSMGGSTSWPGILPYCMSKAAVKQLAEGLHREMASFGIHCASVEPSFYRTPIIENADESYHRERLAAMPQRVRDDYEPLLKAVAAQPGIIRAVASPHLNQPLDVFEHAVTSLRPRRSYLVMDSWLKVGAGLSSLYLPIEHRDIALSLTAKSKYTRWLTTLACRMGYCGKDK